MAMHSGFVVGDRILGVSSGDTHPLWTAAYGVLGPYWILLASAVGQLHLAQEQSRDDAVVARSAGAWLAVAMADGVGSRPLSRYGATYVADSLASKLLQRLLPPVQAVKPTLESMKRRK